MEFPRMVVRPGKQWQLESGWFDLLVVPDQAAYDAALAGGWWVDQYTPAAEAPAPVPEPAGPGDDAPPTRAEMEQKAAELGVKVDGRWSDKRLAAEIEKALS